MPTPRVNAQPRGWSSLRTVTDVLDSSAHGSGAAVRRQQATGRSLPGSLPRADARMGGSPRCPPRPTPPSVRRPGAGEAARPGQVPAGRAARRAAPRPRHRVRPRHRRRRPGRRPRRRGDGGHRRRRVRSAGRRRRLRDAARRRHRRPQRQPASRPRSRPAGAGRRTPSPRCARTCRRCVPRTSTRRWRWCRADGTGFVADAAGEGTTTYAAAVGGALRPAVRAGVARRARRRRRRRGRAATSHRCGRTSTTWTTSAGRWCWASGRTRADAMGHGAG